MCIHTYGECLGICLITYVLLTGLSYTYIHKNVYIHKNTCVGIIDVTDSLAKDDESSGVLARMPLRLWS